MRRKFNRRLLILSGIFVTILIAASLVIVLFFPELLSARTKMQSEATAELLSFALQMAEETGGALEPTIYPVLTAWGFTTEENRVPFDDEITELLKHVGYERIRLEDTTVQLDSGMMLDLGAVGKGYAGDLAAQVLKDNGITSALLDLGGNIQAVGTKPDGSPWRLGLRTRSPMAHWACWKSAIRRS